jgi:hypothetical protein
MVTKKAEILKNEEVNREEIQHLGHETMKFMAKEETKFNTHFR